MTAAERAVVEAGKAWRAAIVRDAPMGRGTACLLILDLVSADAQREQVERNVGSATRPPKLAKGNLGRRTLSNRRIT